MKNNIVRINEADYIDLTDKVTFDFTGDAGEGVINDSLRQLRLKRREKQVHRVARNWAILAGVFACAIIVLATAGILHLIGITNEVPEVSAIIGGICGLKAAHSVYEGLCKEPAESDT